MHNDSYTNYCNKCKMNICTICEEEHQGHDKILLNNMMINKNKLMDKLNELRIEKDKFNDNINKIIKIINKIRETINSYYNLEEYIISNNDL